MRAIDIINKIHNGEAVKIALISDSVGQGYYADGHASYLPNDADNPLLRSYANQLRDYLTNQNPASVLHNLSVAGWSTINHINSGTVGQAISLGVDMVILASGINDARTVALEVDGFKANLQTMINQLNAANVAIILVQEHAIGDKYSAIIAGTATYDTWMNQTSAIKYVTQFIPAVKQKADENGLYVVDCWTPTNDMLEKYGFTGSKLMYDNLHPVQYGHNFIYSILEKWFYQFKTLRKLYGGIPNKLKVHVTPIGKVSSVIRSYAILRQNSDIPESFSFERVGSGQLITKTFRIKNTGNIPGTFDLTAEGLSQSITLEAGAEQTVNWPITTPTNQLGTLTKTLTVTMTTDYGTTTDTYTATANVVDTTAPVITSFNGTRVSNTQVNLTATATDNIGIERFDWYNGTTKIATTTLGSFSATNLPQDVPVTLGVIAYDAAGNASVKATKVFSTIADSIAPTIPTNLVASAVYPNINLTWTASTDNVGVTGYEVERSPDGYNDWVNVGSPVSPSLTDSGVVPGTTYYYRVRALDGAGNASDWSTIVSVIAEEPADIVAPTVGTLTGQAVSHRQIDLAYTGSTDNKAVTKQELYGDGVVMKTVNNGLSFSYSHTQLTAESAHTYYVKAYDSAGNTAQTQPITLTTKVFITPDNKFAEVSISAAKFVERGMVG